MSHSFAEQFDVPCDRCQQVNQVKIWLIVDGEAEPGLLQQIQEDSLNQSVCGDCGAISTVVDKPLLIYRPQQEPPLIFSPPLGVGPSQEREFKRNLIGLLVKGLGGDDDWVMEELKRIGRADLPEALKHQSNTISPNPEPKRKPSKSRIEKSLDELQTIIDELNQPVKDMRYMGRRIKLCQQALILFKRQDNEELWAALQFRLGNNFLQDPQGDRSDNIEQAIDAFQKALQVRTREAMPVEWAISMMNLANAFYSRIRGNRSDNIEKAIDTHKKSLQVRTRAAMPVEWAESMLNLGTVYSDRIRGNRADNIEQAIDTYQQALEVMTREAMPVDWAKSMLNLGTAYSGRIRGERTDNIEQAIDTYHQALQVMTREAMSVDWAKLMLNLGTAYYSRIRGDRAKNIEQAIDAFQKALQVMTRETMPFEWSQVMNNLAHAYYSRIRGDRADNIEQAINAFQHSLQMMSRKTMSVEWAQSMVSLANAYLHRSLGDRSDNVEQAIDNFQQSLRVIPREAMPVDWAKIMHNLATAYSKRIQGARADNIEQAIDTYQQVLQVITRETTPIEWAQSMNHLAIEYFNRIRGDRAENIEQAIDAFQQSLQVRTREAMPVKWSQSMNNLANAYCNRIRGDRAENIEQAIDILQQSLQVMTRAAMPGEWSQFMNNLGTAYRARIRGDRTDNIEQAIDAYQQSLQVRTQEAMPIEWAQSIMNLANAYYSRIRGDRAENIEQAIDAYQRALQVRTQETMPVEWATSMHNLASAYSKRIRGDRVENIEQAIDTFEQLLQVRTRESAMPIDWAKSMINLATAYSNRIREDWADNIEQAIDTYQQVLQVITQETMPIEWATSMHNLAATYSNRIWGDRAKNIEQAIDAYEQSLQVRTRDAMPDDCRETSRLLANLFANESRWQEAASAYAQALAATEDIYNAALSKASQTSELAETGNLFRRAAYAYVQIDDLPNAIATLEQGRARGLRETLERDRADLSAIQTEYPELYERYQKAAETIRALEITERSKDSDSPIFSFTDLRDQAIEARANLNSTIVDIRQLPGYETFLTLPNFDDVAAVVQPGQPLVYLVSTPNGSLALVLHRTATDKVEIQSVSLDFTDAQLRELLVGPSNQDIMTGWLGAYDNRQQDRTQWLQVIDSTTQKLWQSIMAPLVAALTDLNLSQATFIPSGLSSFLPLHAAWTEDTSCPSGRRYACDHIHFSYTPSATALRTAREIATNTPVTNILAIDDPQPVSANPLPNSHPEVTNATSTFPNQNTILSGGNATRESVLAAIPNHSVLHFSCHGYANFRSPLDSGLLLANDETLTLRDFFNTQLSNVRLAILSACETGLPGTDLPDEALSLPTGLLQAGVPGIAASLWSVADLSTMMLLSRFYDYWRQDGLQSSEALRQAQIWIRDTTNGEKITYFEQFMPEFIPKNSTDKMAGQVADFLFKSLMLENPDERTFAHPFHWAAFTYVGV